MWVINVGEISRLLLCWCSGFWPGPCAVLWQSAHEPGSLWCTLWRGDLDSPGACSSQDICVIPGWRSAARVLRGRGEPQVGGGCVRYGELLWQQVMGVETTVKGLSLELGTRQKGNDKLREVHVALVGDSKLLQGRRESSGTNLLPTSANKKEWMDAMYGSNMSGRLCCLVSVLGRDNWFAWHAPCYARPEFWFWMKLLQLWTWKQMIWFRVPSAHSLRNALFSP